MSEININRKDDHLNRSLDFYNEKVQSDFDSIKFVHQVFPELNVESVDIKTSFAGFNLSHFFHINGMTGGSKLTKEYNRKLAIIARETNTLMGVGSLSVALRDDSTIESFSIVRKENPKGIIFANLGADKTLEEAKEACEIIGADGIQIHVNACQEIVMPEGLRKFEGWLSNISNIVDRLGLPVIVKEVGFGMSRDAISKLREIGVKTIDISGRGGTNFARIENSRRDNDKYDFLLDFGNSTPISLLESQKYINDIEILASGGIRNSMDIVKSIALGAKSAAMAGRLINLINKKTLEECIEEINNWKYQIKVIMALLGAKDLNDLTKTDIILQDNVKDWCEIRGINFKKFGNRRVSL